jgi:hypothetical protein
MGIEPDPRSGLRGPDAVDGDGVAILPEAPGDELVVEPDQGVPGVEEDGADRHATS